MTSTHSWYLLYPSPASSSPSSSPSSASDIVSSCAQLLWVTIAGLLGLRICTNAIRMYYFFLDWNLISHKEWADLAAMHFFKQNIITRKKQMKEALLISRYQRTAAAAAAVINTNTMTNTTIATTASSVSNNVSNNNRCDGEPILKYIPTTNLTIVQNQENVNETTSTSATFHEGNYHLSRRNKLSTTLSTTSAAACPICLCDFQDQEYICQSKHSIHCNHVFHSKCLQTWLMKHTSCPVCRYEMVPPTLLLPPILEAHIPSLATASAAASIDEPQQEQQQ